MNNNTVHALIRLSQLCTVRTILNMQLNNHSEPLYNNYKK